MRGSWGKLLRRQRLFVPCLPVQGAALAVCAPEKLCEVQRGSPRRQLGWRALQDGGAEKEVLALAERSGSVV